MTLSDLCLACGLCCEGSLFRYVRLSGDERARLAARGLATFERRDGSHALHLPCGALEGRRCAAYDERPAGCRAYVCWLGMALERGETSAQAAMAIVGQAQALVAGVARELPPDRDGDRLSVLERAHRDGLLGGPEPLRLANEFLREHFLGA